MQETINMLNNINSLKPTQEKVGKQMIYHIVPKVITKKQ